jgi:flavin reductase (DIM6/NTAB) family NADH-FMN oxidoreductase RutF
VTQKTLRDCFGLFPTGVMIASTNFKDKFYGLTINSFSSVSLDPPLLLFSIDNQSSNLTAFKKSQYFSLNILSVKQINLAKEFAKPLNHHKWTQQKSAEPYFLGKFGNPVFENSLGFFECEQHKIIKAGDHHVIIGKIIDFSKLNLKPPLFYVKGEFSAFEHLL